MLTEVYNYKTIFPTSSAKSKIALQMQGN